MPSPCPRCGYEAAPPDPVLPSASPGASARDESGETEPREPASCPHCDGTASLASLRKSPSGPVRGILDGLMAVPMGLYLLATTRRTKRWLVPPFLVSSTVLVIALWVVFGWLSGIVDSALPDEISFAESGWARWEWLEGLGERWDWLKSSWAWVILALQWLANGMYAMVTSRPLAWLGYLLVGSLVAWYAFSIVYEALAGPFLDEVQSRLEERWYGADPRAALERPNDIPAQRCWNLSMLASAGVAGILLIGFFWDAFPFLVALVAAPIPVLIVALLDRRYGQWLAWMARVEGRATWVSLQAALITGVVLVIALPVYFFPFGIGYALYAFITGFATAVGLLDIPFERRGMRLRTRMAFLSRYWLALAAFGVVAGLLLAIPFLGPLLMVPAASTGGLWLICRLDKGFLAERAAPAARR